MSEKWKRRFEMIGEYLGWMIMLPIVAVVQIIRICLGKEDD